MPWQRELAEGAAGAGFKIEGFYPRKRAPPREEQVVIWNSCKHLVSQGKLEGGSSGVLQTWAAVDELRTTPFPKSVLARAPLPSVQCQCILLKATKDDVGSNITRAPGRKRRVRKTKGTYAIIIMFMPFPGR